MNIVDSSGWLAYFADEPNAKHFLAPLSDSALLVVPTVTIYEVFKVILRESSENEALQAVVAMQKGRVVDLSASLAIAASRLSLEHQSSNGGQYHPRNSARIQSHDMDSGFRF
ncbi:MAG: type II toxin-antitoxin system VapC family toxin [Desulfobacterales bacterium]|nr:type II toxin-antitoxin system VapC family toxin [Desulfobacterales bacterium]